MKRSRRGFTLIELMVTVAIMGVLALGAVQLGELAVRRAQEQDLRAALRQIRTAIDDYKRAVDEGRIARKADETGYPGSLEVLVEGAVDATDPAGRRIYFLRRLPREPISGHASDVAAAATWGLRSYDSPPDAPQPGKDVFDVYCNCAGQGINGVPYREW